MNEGAIPNPARNPKARLKSFSADEGALYFRSAGIHGILFGERSARRVLHPFRLLAKMQVILSSGKKINVA